MPENFGFQEFKATDRTKEVQGKLQYNLQRKEQMLKQYSEANKTLLDQQAKFNSVALKQAKTKPNTQNI